MKDLELILPTDKNLSFKLGDTPEFLKKIGEPNEIYLSDETTTYYIYKSKYGFSMCFDSNKLVSLFLYRASLSEEGFLGDFSLLPKNYFRKFNKQEFIDNLEKNSYVEITKKYPFSTDMLNDRYRLRYYERPDNYYIMLDSGNKLR